MRQPWKPLFVAAALAVATLPPTPGHAASPTPSHVFVILEENLAGAAAYGLPYIGSLAQQYGAAYNYSAVTHPSLPNYLAMVSGYTLSTCGDCSGTVPQYPDDNLFHQLSVAGVSWGAYAEGLPSEGWTGWDSGTDYEAKHFPVVYFSDITTDPAELANVHPLSDLYPLLTAPAGDVPSFVWITPNLCDDMHDCSPQSGDQWLAQFLPKILASPAYQDNGTVIITWDESASDRGVTPITMPVPFQEAPGTSGGNVATVVINQRVYPGTQWNQILSHYSVLRALETDYQLPLLGNAATAPEWTDLERLLDPPALATCQGQVAAQTVDPTSATIAYNGGQVTVTGSGGSGSVGIAAFSVNNCLAAWLGPSQGTRESPTFTEMTLTYCGWGDFALNWGTTAGSTPTETYNPTTGCVAATITPTTDPPLSAYVLGG